MLSIVCKLLFQPNWLRCFRIRVVVAQYAFICVFAQGAPDWRNIRNGDEIPSESYVDMPYVVVNDDGSWLCTLTTGVGGEGSAGQHIVSTRSLDHGKSWTPLIAIEPASGPEASWAMPLKTDAGRIYVFYTYNSERRTHVLTRAGGQQKRVDSFGHLFYRFSDDGGVSWSPRKYPIPIRVTDIDTRNVYGGDTNSDGRVSEADAKYFWAEGKPIIHHGAVFIGACKFRDYDPGIHESEGFLFRSDNLLSATSLDEVEWLTLPAGNSGLKSPARGVSEEAKVVGLSDGSLFAITRTVTGYLGGYYSQDGGLTWTDPDFARYEPDGRRIKSPRANSTVRQFSNGKYVLWFHNHSGTNYQNRNPAWIAGGIEKDGHIVWSQPEILLYDVDPATRISYPDFVEQSGRFFVTETQKTVARVHEIDPVLIRGLWEQLDLETNRVVTVARPLIEWTRGEVAEQTLPAWPLIEEGSGLSIEIVATVGRTEADRVMLDCFDSFGRGVRIVVTAKKAFRIDISDGERNLSWESDPIKVGTNETCHAVVSLDGGPRILTWIVDGVLSDGGEARKYGWTRIPPALENLNGKGPVTLRMVESPEILNIYSRPLRTSESVLLYRRWMSDRAENSAPE